MSTTESHIIESYTTHLDCFDAVVEIDGEGNALLHIRLEEPMKDLVVTPDDLAAIDQMWRRATRADD